jgi:hypothetical protein
METQESPGCLYSTICLHNSHLPSLHPVLEFSFDTLILSSNEDMITSVIFFLSKTWWLKLLATLSSIGFWWSKKYVGANYNSI